MLMACAGAHSAKIGIFGGRLERPGPGTGRL